VRAGRSGLATVVALAAALAAAPAAQAAQGSELWFHEDDITYTADPGEANQLTVSGTDPALHLHDPGAAIGWAPDSGQNQCSVSGAHDVFCLDQNSMVFWLYADLGDGNDTFTNLSDAPVFVNLGPGDDRAVGGKDYDLDGGPGADDMRSGGVPNTGVYDAGADVDYTSSPGPLSVTADNVANDGTQGEHDNVHSDIKRIYGSSYDDTISGYREEFGGFGNDTLRGTSGDDLIWGDRGNDVLIGGPGKDRLEDDDRDSTADHNVFYAQDGQADRIMCGTGYDVVYADPQDDLTPSASSAYGGPCDEVHLPGG
jgi:Ca2+-binding RTX toxin-like protein